MVNLGGSIHIFCRIIGLADAFNAMRTERSYKKSMAIGKTDKGSSGTKILAKQ
jgi:response regulator RpfG family c-di-GMP phosphodiesterase